ncbi:MAG: hypothetical protein B0A82_26835 [Alkalinema sp. CACIAM 70d]|nr:MAG: hypothetical protein B0A82_26835 [Alkalinema sp. CACIAM 70d]
MALAHSQNAVGLGLISTLKSILIWSFVLAVCMIVIGFPVLVLVVSIASLMAVTLHAIMPTSAVLLTAVGFIGVHVLGILAVSTFLTLKGIRPHDVEWLRWLHGDEHPADTTSIYASCPLTCDVKG